MKNYTSVSVNGSRVFLYLFFTIALSVFLVSCEQEEMDLTEQNEAALTIENNSEQKASKKNGAPAPGDTSIGAIAVSSDSFDELEAALKFVDAELNAGLVDLFLNGSDQYTVFAPTDAAFEALYDKLGADGIEDLTAPVVLDVLLYHVTEGRRAANSVVPPRNYRTIETLAGKSLKVTAQGEIMGIGSTANIEEPNVSASNGIIHIIDTVLLPF